MMRGRGRFAALIVVLALLAGCAETELIATTAKSGKPAPGTDYKVGKPYQINGVWYYPKEDFDYDETGIASWYGSEFAGRPTASGERFDPNGLSAAHRTLPLPSMVRVTNLENGRSLALRVNDRGPFSQGRIIDVSRRGAQLLGFQQNGTAKVRVEIMEQESRTLAAAGQRQGVGSGQAPPKSAPVSVVVKVPLPGSPPPAGKVTPAPPVAIPAPLPEPDGRVIVTPVHPSRIFVQAGAFAQFENARALSTKLAWIGPAQVTTAFVGEQQFYRVRLGPIITVEEADTVLGRVVSAGHPEARIIVD